MATVLCPHCGTPNREGSHFCNRCGAALLAAPHATPPQQQPASPATPDRAASQPWLDPGFVGEDDVPLEEESADQALLGEQAPLPAPRLDSALQGLLDPIRVVTIPQEGGETEPSLPATALTAEKLRRVRSLMAEEPLVASSPLPVPAPSLWLRWIFGILAIGVAAPLLLGWPLPADEPTRWTGVEPGFDSIQALPSGARVQLLWAFDSATVGEMELVSSPVLRHLAARRARVAASSLLPAGPATAQRLLSRIDPERTLWASPDRASAVPSVRFLPGGAAVLPLLAAEPADLAVLLAAQAEDVQHWLEQVAPRNRVPVLAVTAAGADLPLRPYLESGQLVGLVSGFDGAYQYNELLGQPFAAADIPLLRRQIVGQSYGALTLLAIVLLGNFAAWLAGRPRER